MVGDQGQGAAWRSVAFASPFCRHQLIMIFLLRLVLDALHFGFL